MSGAKSPLELDLANLADDLEESEEDDEDRNNGITSKDFMNDFGH